MYVPIAQASSRVANALDLPEQLAKNSLHGLWYRLYDQHFYQTVKKDHGKSSISTLYTG